MTEYNQQDDWFNEGPSKRTEVSVALRGMHYRVLVDNDSKFIAQSLEWLGKRRCITIKLIRKGKWY